MRPIRKVLTIAASTGLAISLFGIALDASTASASTHRLALGGMQLPIADRSHPIGAVARDASVRFDLMLAVRHDAQFTALVHQVSTPGSRLYRHYLTDAEFRARYAPTARAIATATAWLRSEHLVITGMARDRLFLEVRGTAARVEHAFGTGLAYYRVRGMKTQLTTGTVSIPSSLSTIVTGATGLDQFSATPDLSSIGRTVRPADAEPGPPAGFLNPQPCSSYWGQKLDFADRLPAPFRGPLPYDICGYTPAQLRGGYGLRPTAATDGQGVTIAIVDAYDSPTLLSDAQTYFSINDPEHPLLSSQFTDINPGAVDDAGECGGSGWYDEQALDVEASHTMAPGAHIDFVGAVDCFDSSLLNADTTAITSGASVVSNSWGDTLGDVFDAADQSAFDTEFQVAATTGVSVLFSSGDEGDNFGISGLAIPDYPATSPFVTAVGGTALEIGPFNNRIAEYGWSTAKQILCDSTTTSCAPHSAPLTSLGWDYGGGGGSSYAYVQPSYQAPVVPSDLALRNEALFGPVPVRVIPDIAMDADPATGMLIGLTQVFPNGTYYAQFKEGGTSLASPLLAGVVADADEVAGAPIGFLNPALYATDTSYPSAFNDIVSPTNPTQAATVRVDYIDGVDATEGYEVSIRTLDYQGPETYCDGTGNCATRPVTLTTTPGFDSMTGIGSINGPTFLADVSKG